MKSYTVAQYKNMAGRAGRLGFREEGRSVLIAETGMDQSRLFATYVQGTPEAIKSSFSDRSPDTWLIRLLAQGPKVTKQQAVDLLANTYGGYLASRADPQWRTRIAPQIQDLTNRMLANGLLEEEDYRRCQFSETVSKSSKRRKTRLPDRVALPRVPHSSSPLLSNLVLDELDGELEHRRGTALFAMRTIVTSTFAAGQRVMEDFALLLTTAHSR